MFPRELNLRFKASEGTPMLGSNLQDFIEVKVLIDFIEFTDFIKISLTPYRFYFL